MVWVHCAYTYMFRPYADPKTMNKGDENDDDKIEGKKIKQQQHAEYEDEAYATIKEIEMLC